jgi:nitroreductase
MNCTKDSMSINADIDRPWQKNVMTTEVKTSKTEFAESMVLAINARRTVLPGRLIAPGPDENQLRSILTVAADAPDHGCLMPWRFVLITEAARGRLSKVFLDTLLERDKDASQSQKLQASERAYRSPVLLLVIARITDGESLRIGKNERLVSAGCAIQNTLLMATVLGFGSSLTTGSALKSQDLAEMFELLPNEQAICFINLGTARNQKPLRKRPALEQYFSIL